MGILKAGTRPSAGSEDPTDPLHPVHRTGRPERLSAAPRAEGRELEMPSAAYSLLQDPPELPTHVHREHPATIPEAAGDVEADEVEERQKSRPDRREGARTPRDGERARTI